MGSGFKSQGVHETPKTSHEFGGFHFNWQINNVSKTESFAGLTSEQQIESLSNCVAEVLASYGLGEAAYESINHDYNSTFKVIAPNGRVFALRVNVNSPRSAANLLAEVAWVSQIESVPVPMPQLNLAGEYTSQGWHEASGRYLSAVLYTWLDGVEPGDEPSLEQLRAAGAAMAKLHLESKKLQLPAGAELPDLSDFFWGSEDLLLSQGSVLSDEEQRLVAIAKQRIEATLAELWAQAEPQAIHGDLHPWNVMWNNGELAVFDFDDSGMGLPVQDLATALYYLDTEEQNQAFLEGYKSIRKLPTYTEGQLADLMFQRRLLLLNYLCETSNPEHRAMLADYLSETIRRIAASLE